MMEEAMKTFELWMQEARDQGLVPEEGQPMTLATVSSEGAPSARIVLLKGITPEGIRFFTNYTSKKGQQLASNPNCSVVIHWPQWRRQVRFEGVASKLNEEDSDKYFATRSRESQLGAWASKQSSAMSDGSELRDRLEEFKRKYEGKAVPRPSHWGGFLISPKYIEFWKNGADRLHERDVFTCTDGEWKRTSLFP